jgi:hypothetical protein
MDKPRPLVVVIVNTTDTRTNHSIAASLSDYITPSGLVALDNDLSTGVVYGAFEGERLVGFTL